MPKLRKDQFELIQEVHEANGENFKKTAEIFGISEATVRRCIQPPSGRRGYYVVRPTTSAKIDNKRGKKNPAPSPTPSPKGLMTSILKELKEIKQEVRELKKSKKDTKEFNTLIEEMISLFK